MATSRTKRLKQLQSMNREELIGTIIYLEARQRNSQMLSKQKNDKDDFKVSSERFFDKKNKEHSKTITITRSASRLSTRGFNQ